MNKKIYILISACLLSVSIFTSCGSDELLEGDAAGQGNKTVTFKVQSGYMEDTITRTAQQPETKRIILSDGLLVDATLVDEGNMHGTRADLPATGAQYEDITSGSGMAFVCNGTTIVLKQNITVSGGQVSVQVPPTGSYDIYMYLNEDGNLNLANATVPDNNIDNVTLSSRPQGSKDDYVMVPNISASSSTLGSPVTFYPLGAEVRVFVEAGVTPLTGITTTLTGIQASQATNVHVATGAYTVSTTPGANLTLTKDNGNDPETRYSASLLTNSERLFSINPSASQTATLTINSIIGPDGTNERTIKTYTAGNTMTFTNTYLDKHRYSLILRLATPITGGINLTDGTTSGVWPVLNGVPAYYEWDAQQPEPIGEAEPTPGDPSYYHLGVIDKATQGCKWCPNSKQCSWYQSVGTYGDYSRWYCPGNTTPQLGATVHIGGTWLKKSAQIPGFSADNLASGYSYGEYLQTDDDLYHEYRNPSRVGKPGVTKLKTTDDHQQNPNDWFFLPCASGTNTVDAEMDHLDTNLDLDTHTGLYWCSDAIHCTKGDYEHEWPETARVPFYFFIYSGDSSGLTVLDLTTNWDEQRFMGLCIWTVQ